MAEAIWDDSEPLIIGAFASVEPTSSTSRTLLDMQIRELLSSAQLKSNRVMRFCFATLLGVIERDVWYKSRITHPSCIPQLSDR